jgi:hypothetical protein
LKKNAGSHSKRGPFPPFWGKWASRQICNTKKYQASFPLVSVGIYKQNTNRYQPKYRPWYAALISYHIYSKHNTLGLHVHAIHTISRYHDHITVPRVVLSMVLLFYLKQHLRILTSSHNTRPTSTGGCGKAEHLEKKNICGPKVFDFFGQIIFRSTFHIEYMNLCK